MILKSGIIPAGITRILRINSRILRIPKNLRIPRVCLWNSWSSWNSWLASQQGQILPRGLSHIYIYNSAYVGVHFYQENDHPLYLSCNPGKHPLAKWLEGQFMWDNQLTEMCLAARIVDVYWGMGSP